MSPERETALRGQTGGRISNRVDTRKANLKVPARNVFLDTEEAGDAQA
jgi:hypothetical protein